MTSYVAVSNVCVDIKGGVVKPHLECIKIIISIGVAVAPRCKSAGGTARARRVLVCSRFNGDDCKEAVEQFEIQIFKVMEAKRERERICVQAEGPASSLRSQAEICLA